MKKKYILYLKIIFLLLIFSVFFSSIKFNKLKDKGQYFTELSLKNSSDDMNDELLDDYTVKEDFSTHLPLVVIDLENNTIPNEYKYDAKTESFKLSSDTDPYVCGSIRVIDNVYKSNKLSDYGQLYSKMKIKYRGNTSITYDKKQYGIKLLDENGNENEQSVLGMEADEDWILNISMADKSLIRNYLALNICGEIMNNTPNAKYCEVVMKKGNSYEYEGLYLMMESVKKSKGRVDISSYEEGEKYTSYLLRRDRYNENGIMLDTEASKKQQCYGYLEVKYPSIKNMNDNLYNYILNDINNIEQIIYSDNYDRFSTYSEYIDEDSFIDYFILNEFFMNYDAGNNSTYLYKDLGEKLKIGPVWDFDISIDNYKKTLENLKKLNFDEHPWFERLVRSKSFTTKLVKRYKQLRKDVLSYEYIDNRIDDTVDYIRSAQIRDYQRWKNSYSELTLDEIKDENGILVDRTNEDFNSEIQRIKDNLKIHGEYLLFNLESLNSSNDRNYSRRMYGGFTIIFLLIFFSSIIMVRRRYQ